MRTNHFLLSVLTWFISVTVYAQYSLVVAAKDVNGNTYQGTEGSYETGVSQVGISERAGLAAIVAVTKEESSFSSGKSSVTLFDMNRQKEKWHHEVKGKVSDAIPTDFGVVTIVGGKMQLLDLSSGIFKWDMNIRPVYVADSLGLVLGYKGNSSSKLLCCDLRDGHVRWQGDVSIENSYGWDELLELPDGRLLVVADNIYVIDLLSGEIQKHEASTGYKQVGRIVADILGNVIAGAALGVMSYALFPRSGIRVAVGMPYYEPSVINHLSSNILCQDSSYYIADRYCLRAFNSKMEPSWEYKFPTEKSSKSLLFGNYGTVYMLNMGFGVRGSGETVKNSKPFISSFNSLTGEPFFFTPLSMKKDAINDAMITPWEAWYLFDDGLVFQSDINDSIVSVADWDWQKKGKIREAVHDTIFVMDEKTHVLSPVWCNWKELPMLLENGSVVVVDKNLKEVAAYPRDNVYFELFSTDRYRFVSRQYDKTSYDVWVLGLGDDKRQVHLTKKVNQVWMHGNHVYYTTNRAFGYFSF